MKSHSRREDLYFQVKEKLKIKEQNKILAVSSLKDQSPDREVQTL